MFDKNKIVTLQIEGMSCAHCRKAVSDALLSVKGVKTVAVALDPGSARVGFIEKKTNIPALKAAVEDAGYTVTAIEEA